MSEFHFGLEFKPKRTDRIEKLLESIIKAKPYICFERAYYVTNSYKQTESEPNVIRRAKAIREVLQNMTIYIQPESLLVGNQASKPRSAPLFPEDSIDWIEREILKEDPYPPDQRPKEAWMLPNDVKKQTKELVNYWKGKTHRDKVWSLLPDEAKICENNKYIWCEYLMESRDAHYIPDFSYLLKNGLRENIKRCKQKLNDLDLLEPGAFEKKAFYEAVIISNEAFINFAHRYSKLAKEIAEKESRQERKRELEEIARICRRIPENPPDSFYEALQMIYFIMVVLQIENSGHSLSLGRFDQYLYPFYQRDIVNRRIVKDKALELIQNFFIMLNNNTKVRSEESSQFLRGNPLHQNLTIGGQLPITYEDATNDLTYLVLEACANNIPCTEPQLSARYHQKAPEKYLMECIKVIRLGTGFPALFNDECIIPALINRGYDIDEAYDYGIIGCVEPGVAGLLGGRAGGTFVNHPKWLEMALNNGKDPSSGIQLHPGKGDLSTFRSYNEVWEAYLDQFDYYSKIEAIMQNVLDLSIEELLDDPLMSSLGCPKTTIERGKGIRKGGAKYDFSGEQALGVATVGNSLTAIKWAVFDKKLLTGSQLKHALLTNFEDQSTDPTGEEIRQILLNAPKFGNDDNYADSITAEAFRYHCNTITSYKNTRYGRGPKGCIMNPSTSTVSANVPFGMVVGATPDGRKAGEALSDGCSPMRQTDKEGPTAALSSVAKLPNILCSDGQLYNLKFSPKDLKDEEGMRRVLVLIETFFAKKGFHMQFNVVSTKTLRDAQKHPEKYPNLMVRVAGYSARFIDLDPAVQEDIISRTTIVV